MLQEKSAKSNQELGSFLGPFLYLLYTADLPADANVSTATFADDIAVLAIHKDPSIASKYLHNLNFI